MKKILLTTALICTIGASSAFAVVDNSQKYLPFAQILADKDIIVRQATVDGYMLDHGVLRQEVVGMAVRIANLNLREISRIELPDNYTCQNLYFDLTQTAPNTWICRAAEIAARHGIITLNNGHFRPEDEVTRAEALAILMKALKYEGDPEFAKYEYPADTVEWQKQWISQAKKFKMIPDTRDFRPNDPATRGEIFSMTSNLLAFTYLEEAARIRSFNDFEVE